jgi:hypothetical protein
VLGIAPDESRRANGSRPTLIAAQENPKTDRIYQRTLPDDSDQREHGENIRNVKKNK